MDEIERRIRAARPISGHRNLPLSGRAKRELADLVLADAPEVTRQRRNSRTVLRRPLIWAAAVVVFILAVASSAAVLQPVQAWAATPPLLVTTPIAGTAAELLNQMADAAAATGDPAPTGDVHIEVRAWVLNTNDNGNALTSVVAPQEYSIDRHADGSYTSVTIAGPPLEYAGSAAASDDVPPAGSVLSRMDLGPGEYKPLFPSPFPAATEKVGPYFEQVFGAGIVVGASILFQNIPLVLMDYVLGGSERAAALHYLAGLPGIDVVGAVTDRLGRAGIMFGAARTGDPDALDYLVIAPESGRILAAETHYIGHERTDIRSPSVTSYYAWK